MTGKRTGWLVFCVALVVSGLMSAESPAAVDEGVARYAAWSGSYWPIREGAMIFGPLTKYDRVTGSAAARWEMQANPPHAEVPEWFGYCHAWSSAAVLDHEPTRRRTVRGLDGSPVELGIADQKGMLTACHTDDVAQHYGVRYDGQPEDDPQDIYPDELWRVLKLYIQQNGVPIIVDVESGPQVWNFPVYAYRVVYRPAGAGDRYFAEMTLWMADDAVPPNIVGVQVTKQTFYFTFVLREGAAQLGTGRWVEPSVNNHPDFAWFPYIVRAENPEVDYERVRQLLGFPESEDRPLPAPGLSPPAGGPPGAGGPTGSLGGSIPLDNRTGAPATLTVPPNPLPSLPTQPPPSAVGASEPSSATAPPGIQPGAVAHRPWLLSPLELLRLIVDRTSRFDLDVTVDKFDGGHYDSGEPITVHGISARSGYLYLFYLDSEGGLQLLFPRGGQDNWIEADARFHLPSAVGGQAFRASAPAGVHRIKAIVTARRLLFSGLELSDRQAERWTEREAAAVVAPGRFRLPPSQESIYRRQVLAHLRGNKLPSKSLEPVECEELLQEFAQDETAFYVRGNAPASHSPASPRGNPR